MVMDLEFPNGSQKLFSKKNLISYLMLAIIILAIPLTVKLVQEQQILKSRAQAGPPIKFTGTGVDCSRPECTSTSATLDIELLSPLGPPP